MDLSVKVRNIVGILVNFKFNSKLTYMGIHGKKESHLAIEFEAISVDSYIHPVVAVNLYFNSRLNLRLFLNWDTFTATSSLELTSSVLIS